MKPGFYDAGHSRTVQGFQFVRLFVYYPAGKPVVYARERKRYAWNVFHTYRAELRHDACQQLKDL